MPVSTVENSAGSAFVKAQYHWHTCENRNLEEKLHPTEVGNSTGKDKSQNETLGYSVHKGAWSRHNATNNNRLTTITEEG